MEYYCYNGRRVDRSFFYNRGRNRLRSIYRVLALFTVMAVVGIFYQITEEERLLKESWSAQTADYDSDCDIAIAMGSDLPSSRGMFASINSIIANYHQPNRKLCFFVFSTKADYPARKKGLECVFGTTNDDPDKKDPDKDQAHSQGLPSNVQIFHKEIDRDAWDTVIYTQHELQGGSGSANALEYLYARYYLKPADVDGHQRVIWIDSDTIVRGDVQELYDWDLKGQVVAAASYWEPLKNYLCTNPRLNKIKMKTPEGKYMTPFQVKKHLNNGLLVIDLYQMQRQRILQKWHALLISHELQCLWVQGGDQGFYLALNGEYEELPNVWNVGYLGKQEYHRYNDACQNGKMLHWNGSGKPYNEGRSASLCVDQFDMFDVVAMQNKGECLRLP